MKWRDLSSGEDVTAKDESSAGTVKFSIVVEMTPSHNGGSFTCQTYFDKPQSQDKSADNIPINNNAFNVLYTSQKLNVYCKYWVPIWFELSHNLVIWAEGLVDLWRHSALRYMKLWTSGFAFSGYCYVCTRIWLTHLCTPLGHRNWWIVLFCKNCSVTFPII